MKKSTQFLCPLLLLPALLTAPFCGSEASGQQSRHKVSGVITDQSGTPVPGTTVVVPGTTSGTVSGANGEYSLEVPLNSTMEVSHMGYITQSIEIGSKSVINVMLEESAISMDDVVVVGYGVQKKSNLTGSISQVKGADMEARSITSATQALSGKVSGVQTYTDSGQPGAEPTIQIRGIGSNYSSNPLYVVDGRVASGIGSIDPNDIESIEVLKDGASAAIYGASAGNGVILVTTKKGKGDGTISYDFQIVSQSIARVPQMMNSEQFIDYYAERGALTMSNVYKYWDFKQNTDWVDVAFGNSLMHRHSLKFQGSNDKMSYFTSLSYLNNDGMIKGKSDVYDRITGMVNVSYKVKPWLEVGTDNYIEYSKVKTVDSGMNNLVASSLLIDPLTPSTYTLENMPDNMKNALANPETYGRLLQDKNGNYYSVSPFVNSNRSHPFIIRDYNKNETRIFGLSGTTYLNLKPVKGLVITSRLGYSLSSIGNYGADIPYSSHYSSGSFRTNAAVNAGSSSPTSWQWENFANYSNSFGNHNLTAMIGMSYSESRSFGVNGSVSGINGKELGFLKEDPRYYFFEYASATATRVISGGEPRYTRKLAYFGRINYDYKNKYLFQVSLRADAADTSILPSTNRMGYFPAVSGGWAISEEGFMQNSRQWLSHLKLRASWGRNGSISSLSNWMYDVTISHYGRYSFSDQIDYSYGYAPSVMGNYDLKWETSEQLNIGLDASLWNNRFNMSVDYFEKNTKDLIIEGATLSYLAGVPSSPINAGNMTNKGWEVELGWQDRKGDFTYGIRANMTTLKNNVTKMHESVSVINGQASVNNITTPVTRFEVGRPAWYFLGYKYLGVDKDTGNPIFEDIDKDGSIGGDADKTYIGKAVPDFTYGITFTAAWKGLDLLIFGSGVQGVDIYNQLNQENNFITNKLAYFTEDRWTSSHTDGSRPRANADNLDLYTVSSAMVFDGSYFKIKQIQLGYTLPQKWMESAHMKSVRVYASLEDFFTFTKYIGFDPEVTGSGMGAGVDMGRYPLSKKVIFGLNLTF